MVQFQCRNSPLWNNGHNFSLKMNRQKKQRKNISFELRNASLKCMYNWETHPVYGLKDGKDDEYWISNQPIWLLLDIHFYHLIQRIMHVNLLYWTLKFNFNRSFQKYLDEEVKLCRTKNPRKMKHKIGFELEDELSTF